MFDLITANNGLRTTHKRVSLAHNVRVRGSSTKASYSTCWKMGEWNDPKPYEPLALLEKKPQSSCRCITCRKSSHSSLYQRRPSSPTGPLPSPHSGSLPPSISVSASVEDSSTQVWAASSNRYYQRPGMGAWTTRRRVVDHRGASALLTDEDGSSNPWATTSTWVLCALCVWIWKLTVFAGVDSVYRTGGDWRQIYYQDVFNTLIHTKTKRIITAIFVMVRDS